MFCKKAILVNWGNIPHLEFEFGPVNLFSGGNGSGKTTAADGLQSLMTAAHENLFTYNPGQDETTQKGRGGKQVRTLASYVLGCDDGSYSRPRVTDGYVAGIFHPTQGEKGEAFTAVMCVRASLDSAGASRQARQEELQFLIVPHEQLTLGHFIREDKGGKYVVPINTISSLLAKEFGKQNVEVYDKKGPYLRRLYGALRGLRGAVPDREAKHAARTFSNFMAYKPVKSINDFVAKEVLYPKDLSEDIKQVSELMKTIHSMEEETRYVNDAIANLEQASELAEQYVSHYIDYRVGLYKEGARKCALKQAQYVKLKNEKLSFGEEYKRTEALIVNNKDKKSVQHERLIELEAQRQGITALKDKDQLERDLETYKANISSCAPRLLEQNHQFVQNYQYVQTLLRLLKESSIGVDIPGLEAKVFRKHAKSVLDAGLESGVDAQKLFNSDWVGIGDLEQKLVSLIELESIHRSLYQSLFDADEKANNKCLRDQLMALVDQRKEAQSRLKQKIVIKQGEIQKLENASVTYPGFVEQALSAIEDQCPKAKPRVLCDFIEVIDPVWQMSIEGYIGGNRFSIIVEPEYEADAVRIVRGLRGKRNNARVLQGEKVLRDAAKVSVPKGSIMEVMEFEHKVVEYYIKATYGNVLRVDSEDELKKTARGITFSGLGSGGYSMFRCDLDDGDLVFGRGARDRAMTAKLDQLDVLKKQLDQADELFRQASSLYECVGHIKSVNCVETVRTLLDYYRGLQRAENQLSDLDLSQFEEFEIVLSEAKKEFSEIEKEALEYQHKLGELASNLKKIDLEISKVSVEQESLQELQDQYENKVIEMAKVYGHLDAESVLNEADQQALQAKNDFCFDDEVEASFNRFTYNERELHSAILNYNQSSNVDGNIAYLTVGSGCDDPEYFKSIILIQREVESAYNRLKNNVLVGKHEQLKSLKDSFNTAFVTNLCHSIYQSISEGRRILDDLNAELEHHRFGVDQERFYFGFQWIPEFKEYHKFFKELIDTPDLGDGSTLFEAELSEKSCQVRDKLMAMLLDKDEQYALNELKRISDYRNYREYEIFKEPLNKDPIALSKYGTGSGGQLETPAYIIRSAAVTSAFKFNEGACHCRMVLVDEAFSKMDETRSREVIKYLTETLGLQLIFIMPTSKSGPFMDLISHQVVFSKCPVQNKVGELNTIVNVNRSLLNQEKIQELWAQHRVTIRHQGSLDFMEGII